MSKSKIYMVFLLILIGIVGYGAWSHLTKDLPTQTGQTDQAIEAIEPAAPTTNKE